MESEIIGIIGTLLGTTLGWILNNFSKKGKLKINADLKSEFLTSDNLGGYRPSDNKEDVELYNYRILLCIYNSSAEIRVMRDISVGFYHDKELLFKSIPLVDAESERKAKADHYNPVVFFNLPAKTAISEELRGIESFADNQFSKLWDVNRVVLTYKNEKNREKRVQIFKDSFDGCLDN